jgi:hypothetical protein
MEPWRKLDEHVVYSRYRRVVSKRFVQPGGKVVEYEIKDEDDMVAVLALTPAREIVLVRQFRPGPEAVLLELPAVSSRRTPDRRKQPQVNCSRKPVTAAGSSRPERCSRRDTRIASSTSSSPTIAAANAGPMSLT